MFQYLNSFKKEVRGKAPDAKLFSRYFQQGLTHLRALSKPAETILGVENKVNFMLGDYPFVGFIDLLLQGNDGGITVWDHKSHALKQRSTRGKYTKSDEELDAYLRQLYLYSIPVEAEYGVLPKQLAFNCYRTGEVIIEPFSKTAYEASKQWALGSIARINASTDWCPNMDYYFCKHICDVHDSCEYYAMEYGKKRFRTERTGDDL